MCCVISQFNHHDQSSGTNNILPLDPHLKLFCISAHPDVPKRLTRQVRFLPFLSFTVLPPWEASFSGCKQLRYPAVLWQITVIAFLLCLHFL